MEHRTVIIMTLLFACIMLFSAIVIVSNQVQEKQSDLSAMSHEIDLLEQETKALKAEWSYLTRPQRLEALSQGRDIDASQHGGIQ